jgi:Domain of unknown function (DUF4062)
MAGMRHEREAAVAAITAVDARPVWFEDFGGMDDNPEDAYLGQVASSSIYLGILGERYGRPLPSGYSPTHAEYNAAERGGLRISVWNAQEGLDGRQQDFLNEVRVFHTTGTYISPDDLRARVEARLRVMADEALSPWVKIGRVVVRATSITNSGTRIVLSTIVRDDTVAHTLESMRPSNSFGRNSQTRITWPTGTTNVRVTEVSTTVSSSLSRDMTITAEVLRDESGTPPMGVNGRSPEELTEIALRSALFGEPNPLGNMAFMAHADNPLPLLRGSGLGEDAVEQVARLLITEQLVAGLRGGHITQFRLGPTRAGTRRLRLDTRPALHQRRLTALPDRRNRQDHMTSG